MASRTLANGLDSFPFKASELEHVSPDGGVKQ